VVWLALRLQIAIKMLPQQQGDAGFIFLCFFRFRPGDKPQFANTEKVTKNKQPNFALLHAVEVSLHFFSIVVAILFCTK